MRYPVNEIFQTIQGEATFTGTPAIFIRMQGCPVGCAWCDTKHTWDRNDRHTTTLDEVLAKTQDSDRFVYLSEQDLVEQCRKYEPWHVVLTGGEPCLYDLGPLTKALLDDNYTVQVETSGTSEIRVDPRTFVTVSPKIGMPGGLPVLDSAMGRANEIKYPVGKLADCTRLELEVLRKTGDATVWLQPLSQSKKATALCVDYATRHGHRVSIQVHKFIGIR
jgi:7-carboxy-7-deazaguanine synthase